MLNSSSCKTEYFIIGKTKLSFSDQTLVEIKNGKLSAQLHAKPVSFDVTLHENIFESENGFAVPGFRFDEISFPTTKASAEIIHPGKRTYIRENNFKYGLRYFGKISIQNGWLHMQGVLRQDYQTDDQGAPVSICKKFEDAPVDPSFYFFDSIHEAVMAGVENVFKLSADIQSDQDLDLISQFKNLKNLYLTLKSKSPLDLKKIMTFKNLEVLNMGFAVGSSGNPVQSLPVEIGHLTELKTLTLNLKLSSMPVEISHLKKLEHLELAYNSLTKIPDEIINLKKLITLKLTGNKLISLPEDIGFMPRLTRLDIKENSFTSLPKSLDQIKELYIDQKHKALYKDISYHSLFTGTVDESLFTDKIEFHTTIKASAKTVGQSRLAGSPDLPANFSHPNTNGKLWTFVAQVNLSNITILQKFLPRTGLLSFFCEDSLYPDKVQVFHFKDLTTLKKFSYDENTKFSENDKYTFAESYLVDFEKSTLTPPSPEDDTLPEPKHPHCINGYVYTHKESPQELAAISKGGLADEWIILLSLGYDQNLRLEFGDAGTLTFCIHKKDLAIADFQNVCASVEG